MHFNNIIENRTLCKLTFVRDNTKHLAYGSALPYLSNNLLLSQTSFS